MNFGKEMIQRNNKKNQKCDFKITSPYQITFFFRVDFEIEVRWVIETVSPTAFNRKNLYFGVSRCCRQAGAVVETFLDEARLSATANVIFRRLEVIEGVFLVFERIVFMNIEKKKSVWSISMTK